MTTGSTAHGEDSFLPGSIAPTSTRHLVLFGAGALLSSLGIIFWLGTGNPESFMGFLHSANETITAGRQARITEILVKPGQVVVPGTPLLQLRDAPFEQERVQQQQLIAALEAELRQAQARAIVEIADRKAKLDAELFETQLKLAGFEEKRFDQRLALFASENRVMLVQAEERLSQVQMASAGEFKLPVEPLTLTDAGESQSKQSRFLFELQERETTRNKLETSEAQVTLCEVRLELLKKQLENAPAQINEAFGVTVIQTRIASAQASLVKLDAEAPTLTLAAARHGTVGVFAKGAGDLVASQDVIVELFDADQPYVLTEIPTNLLTQFPAGTEVELRFAGSMRRLGMVSELPPQATTLPGPHERLTDQCGRLRLRILPSGKVWPQVPFGSQVEMRAVQSTGKPS